MVEHVRNYINEMEFQPEAHFDKRPIVLKFGGTSVGSIEGINHIAEIVSDQQKEGRVLVVVSAMSGVTDELLEIVAAKNNNQEQVAEDLFLGIVERHNAALLGLLLKEEIYTSAGSQLNNGYDLLELDIRNHDDSIRSQERIASHGEKLSSIVISANLRNRDMLAIPVDATEVVVSDGKFTDATVNLRATREKAHGLLATLEEGIIPVVTGFIAATHEGETTTLGRGGSDHTAASLATVLQAKELQLWTDVDGVYTDDPRHNPEAVRHDTLDFYAAEEIADNGAKVIYSKTFPPLHDTEIPIWVRNTFSRHSGGTFIRPSVYSSA